MVDMAESKQVFTQRLSQWVSFTDAGTLYAALDSGTAQVRVKPVPAGAGTTPAARLAISEEVSRVRAAMVDLMQRSCSPTPAAARMHFPVPGLDTPPELAFSYSPFHRFYLAQQREMDAKLGPLRARVRHALAAASPALRQLAALDAALDSILADRERSLFSRVPVLLEKRYGQLLKAHQQTYQALAGGGQTDDPATWLLPGAWLANFRDELLVVLLAELDLRLQPVTGLMEAFDNKIDEPT